MAEESMKLVTEFDQTAAVKLVLELMAVPGRSKQEGRVVTIPLPAAARKGTQCGDRSARKEG